MKAQIPKYTPLQPFIGAAVEGVVLSMPLSPALVKSLRVAWLKYKVLVFRNQHISRAQHLQFAAAFGFPEAHPAFGLASNPNILEIREVPGRTCGDWHTDVSYQTAPPSGVVLRAWEVPGIGGDTIFANTAVAYARLDEGTKVSLAGLKAEHAPGFQRSVSDAVQLEALDAANPAVEHPVVIVHPETGEPALFVNEFFTTRIVGLPPAESDALLSLLFAEIKRPEFQVRIHWEKGTIVFWDERTTQHYAIADYSEHRRLDRVTLLGSVPVAYAAEPVSVPTP